MEKRVINDICPFISNQDMALSREMFGGYFASPAGLPVSFTYGGRRYRGLPSAFSVTHRLLDATMRETVFSGRLDENLYVRAECVTYFDFPVVEWTVYFENKGECDSEKLCCVRAIDTAFPYPGAGLVHCNGDFYSEDGYTVSRTALTDGAAFEQAPSGGRPCDGAFPYQRLLFDGFGLNISIGWPGQWSCTYKGLADGVAFQAGQQTVNTYIKPGEALRTPRMTLAAFMGNEERGINVWRRFFNAHVTPRRGGRVLEPRLVMSENGGGIEFTKANEKNQLKGIAFAAENMPDVNLWWIDAGWYPCAGRDGNPDWTNTGSWYPDPDRFPNGLGPVGKACRDAGMDLLVWFEPERVKKNTWIHREHPDWVLASEKDPDNFMLDLTNPECFRWLSETISELIRESGIGCYRQDFNFAPLPFWTDNTGPGREGMLENKYIQAYLAYWDYLRVQNPDLWIDSCSSGGRRNDLETMRRSVPLHPTDYGYGYHHVNQAFRRALCAWIPYTRSWTGSWDKCNEYYSHDDYYAVDPLSYDNFKVVNGYGVLSFVGGASELKAMPEVLPYARKMAGIWRRFAELMLRGDYYALTEDHRNNTKWTVFQFDIPEKAEGAIQALRNNQSAEDALVVKPRALRPDVDYMFVNEETGEHFIISGCEAAECGIALKQPVRSGAVWFYRAAPGM